MQLPNYVVICYTRPEKLCGLQLHDYVVCSYRTMWFAATPTQKLCGLQLHPTRKTMWFAATPGFAHPVDIHSFSAIFRSLGRAFRFLTALEVQGGRSRAGSFRSRRKSQSQSAGGYAPAGPGTGVVIAAPWGLASTDPGVKPASSRPALRAGCSWPGARALAACGGLPSAWILWHARMPLSRRW